MIVTTPLPDGPATVDAVAGWLGIPEGNPERAHVAEVVPAVNALVATWHTPSEAGVWPDSVRMGAVMLAARITRRRNSPGGVETLTDLGPTYVARYDADLDRLLRLGGWRDLVVG